MLELRDPSNRPSYLSTEGWEGPIQEGFLQEEARRGAGPKGEVQGPSTEHTPHRCPVLRLPGSQSAHPNTTATNHNRNCPTRPWEEAGPWATRTSRRQRSTDPSPNSEP